MVSRREVGLLIPSPEYSFGKQFKQPGLADPKGYVPGSSICGARCDAVRRMCLLASRLISLNELTTQSDSIRGRSCSVLDPLDHQAFKLLNSKGLRLRELRKGGSRCVLSGERNHI